MRLWASAHLTSIGYIRYGDPAKEVFKDALQDLIFMCGHVRETFDEVLLISVGRATLSAAFSLADEDHTLPNSVRFTLNQDPAWLLLGLAKNRGIRMLPGANSTGMISGIRGMMMPRPDFRELAHRLW
ncbi:hypothetical protein IFM89_032330 [Coptis chinensis]|uniref:Uncharacterized protein n=1 Tax=Coptis chinensis TaxID=261450 RepID=A0A835M553_9MAGN|nr:hypothetical protein IFM89_032330 [Coptis chinensis]